jgi:hypothetical protein
MARSVGCVQKGPLGTRLSLLIEPNADGNC